jgi:hypothetical protein
MLGLGLSIPQVAARGSRSLVATIRSLFAANEPGVWYDPSDIKLDWRRNLLTKTEQFDDAVWPKDAVSVTPDVVAAPDGSLTADKLVASATNANHLLNRTAAFKTVSGVLYTYTMFAKAAEYSWIRLQIQASAFPETWANFNVATGAVGLTTGNVQTIITAEANGWYRCSITARANASGNSGVQPFVLDSNRGTANPSYTGDGYSGVYIWGAQLEVGSTATPYQRITDGIQDYYAVQALPVLYQDAVGTTPVTAVEQPVGLMLDKSKGMSLGPELVTNGDFSNGTTGWTVEAVAPSSVTFSSGSVTLYRDAASSDPAIVNIGEGVLGKTYLVTFDVLSVSDQTKNIGIRFGVASSLYPLAIIGAPGKKRFIVTANGSGLIAFRHGGTGPSTVVLDNISVRELPGNHAYQTTATSRPVLSARYNLLTKTEQFDDAAWTKTRSSVVANTIAAPDGTLTADKLVEDTSTGSHLVLRTNIVTPTIGQVFTGSVYVRAAERSSVRLHVAGSAGNVCIVNLVDGTVTTTTGSPVVASAGNGWWRISLSYTAPSESKIYFEIDTAIGTATSYTGDGTSGIYIWGADLRVANVGANLPPYQRVNTATDYDTVGFPHYLRFDGVDDWLVTNTITPGIDKVQMFAGVRKLSDAAVGVVCELSGNINSSAGAFNLAVPTSVVTPGRDSFRSYGAPANTFVVDAGFVSPAPASIVYTGISDISGRSLVLRRNGAEASQNTAGQGTGNYLAYPLYIGRRAGTSFPFNGHLYSLIVRFGSNLPAATIGNAEKYINTKTRAY